MEGDEDREIIPSRMVPEQQSPQWSFEGKTYQQVLEVLTQGFSCQTIESYGTTLTHGGSFYADDGRAVRLISPRPEPNTGMILPNLVITSRKIRNDGTDYILMTANATKPDGTFGKPYEMSLIAAKHAQQLALTARIMPFLDRGEEIDRSELEKYLQRGDDLNSLDLEKLTQQCRAMLGWADEYLPGINRTTLYHDISGATMQPVEHDRRYNFDLGYSPLDCYSTAGEFSTGQPKSLQPPKYKPEVARKALDTGHYAISAGATIQVPLIGGK